MTAPGPLPQTVLSDALVEAIAGRRVKAALFTTYTFDPGFFELNVLPLLFDLPFHPVDKVKRIQLEDALRDVEEIAVYYDRTALAPDALPASLDYRRIDVRRERGVFHPKVVLLLVEPRRAGEDDDEPGLESLIVGILSANLTRAGWWENVECLHFEEIRDKDDEKGRWSFRGDLLDLLRRIRQTAAAGEGHAAMDRIHAFLTRRVRNTPYRHHSSRGRFHTRIYAGQDDLPSWLRELRLDRRDWNLEIISPFFDHDATHTLARLVEALAPRETRVYLPREVDGSAQVTERLYRTVADSAHWGVLPPGLLRPGARGATEQTAPRRVHAKVYRLWSRDEGEIVLAGSVNLTAAAHRGGSGGNLEAAYLVDTSDRPGARRWWLDRIDFEPGEFLADLESEDARPERVVVDLSLRYHWGAGSLHYRIEGEPRGPLRITDLAGRDLFVLPRPEGGAWIDCGPDAAAAVRELLPSTSFLRCHHPDGDWRVLVREEGMGHRPSLLAALTPEEILLYWSLLSPAQKAAFIEEKLRAEALLEGLRTGVRERYTARDTLFDRFAGIYHAFEQLHRHVDRAIAEGRRHEAVARLFGAKYDSLPVLLEKVHARRDDGSGPGDEGTARRDPVTTYVTFLSARQIADRVRRAHPRFWDDHAGDRAALETALARLPEVRVAIPIEDAVEKRAFLDWYEPLFLAPVDVPEDAR